jgi:hypothetical protein
MKKHLKAVAKHKSPALIVFNLCFFAYLAWWVRDNIDLTQLLQALGAIPPKAILTAMAINLFSLTFYSARLATILSGRLFPCFIITTTGFTLNSLLPFRLGEGAKIYIGHSVFDYPIGALGVSVVIEKLYDLAAIIILALIVVLGAGSGVIDLRMLAPLCLIGALGAVGLYLIRMNAEKIARHLEDWPVLASLGFDAQSARADLAALDHPIGRATAFTAALWLTNMSLATYAFNAFLHGAGPDIFGAITLLLIIALAIAVPASPAGLGVVEAGITTYLVAVLGASKEEALSAALAYHFVITTPHSCIALAFLCREFFRRLASEAVD